MALSRHQLKKFKRKLQALWYRRIAMLFHTAKHHREKHQENVEHFSAPKPKPPRSADFIRRRDARLARLRTRSRDRDQGVKQSAKEEQLWKLKSESLREKSRHRKKEAMDRWKIAATSSGAFRGV